MSLSFNRTHDKKFEMKKSNLGYVPDPRNTENIELPEVLLQEIEIIAQNVHEEWAQKRMSEGWVYGVKRDDLHKYHPGLIPYGDLSEEEKEYDRQTALSTIKMVVLLGHKIE
jgi:ryanodine receptor 2